MENTEKINLEELSDVKLLEIVDELQKGSFEENSIVRILSEQIFGGDSLTQILSLPAIILPIVADRMKRYRLKLLINS